MANQKVRSKALRQANDDWEHNPLEDRKRDKFRCGKLSHFFSLSTKLTARLGQPKDEFSVSLPLFIKLNFRTADFTLLLQYSLCIYDTVHWITFSEQIQTNTPVCHLNKSIFTVASCDTKYKRTNAKRVALRPQLATVNRFAKEKLLLHVSICCSTYFFVIAFPWP